MNDMEEFFTQDNANEGAQIDLFRIDGTKSGHWLVILGTDSDMHHMINAKARRALGVIEIEGGMIADLEERENFLLGKQLEWEIKIIAALLKSWSFEMEPTHENKIDFLTKAPQIREQINKLATRRQLFIKAGSKN